MGAWNSTDEQIIVSRMANPDFQQVIKETNERGASRIGLENYIVLLDGPGEFGWAATEEGERIAREKFRNLNNSGQLTQVDPERQKLTDEEVLQEKIDTISKQKEEAERAINSDPYRDAPFVLFADDDSRISSTPWIFDHELDKIEFIEDGTHPSVRRSTKQRIDSI